MDKVAARQIGVAKALLDFGYSPEAIKIAFVQQGISEGIVKEAIWGNISKLLLRGGKYLGKAFGAGATPAKGYMTRGMVGKSADPFAQWLGGTAHRGATGLQAGMESLATNPWSTLGRGALETGKGALYFGGRGIGGTLGKGIGGYHMGRMILGD